MIEIRPVLGLADLERWVALRNEVFPDDPEHVEMMVLVRASELDHVDLLALDGAEVVGTGMLAGDPSISSGRAWMEITVPERHRRRGIGTSLLDAITAHAQALGHAGLDCEAREDDPYSVAWLGRKGFAEAGRQEQLALGLAAAGAGPEVPEGVELVRLSDRPDLVSGMFELAHHVYSELGGPRASQAQAIEEWQVYELGSPALRLELTPVALARDEVVGYATMIELPDGRTGLHRTTAVHPDWRLCGVGEAVVVALIAEARERGLASLLVWPESESLSELFGRLGYVRRTADITFCGPPL